MRILENVPLLNYNSFGFDVRARYFISFSQIQELDEASQLIGLKNESPFILGGGTNILLTKDITGWVFKNELRGIEKYAETNEFVFLKIGAGENWHKLVLHCVKNNWGGVENLSLIPGLTGAAPIQNIGAYGVELEEVVEELEAWHIQDRKLVRFSAKDCAFGYRNSVFKEKYKGQFVILSVSLRLNKNPTLKTYYGAIEQELEKMKITNPTVSAVSKAVIRIRESKLPDPMLLGNSGSFFKNPVIDKTHWQKLSVTYPNMVAYPSGSDHMKLAAGWLIEQCGWKGFRRGNVGVHSRQALVLVNYGGGAGADILRLSQDIQASVQKKFSVHLEPEVNIY